MKAMICLVCVAIAATTTGRLVFPVKSAASAVPPPVAKPQPIRVVDTTPFRVRWEPIQGRPPAIDQTHEPPKENVVRTIPIKQERDLTMYAPASEPELREPVRSPQRRMHERRSIRYASAGGEKATCIRVHMRTVYRNGGRSWNCRK